MKTVILATLSAAFVSNTLGCKPAPVQSASVTLPPFTSAPFAAAERWTVHSSEDRLGHAREVSVEDGEVFLRCLPVFKGVIHPTLTQTGGRLAIDLNFAEQIRYRIDNGPVQSESWVVSPNLENLFIPPAVLTKAIRSKRMILEYRPQYLASRPQTFDLTGLREAASKAGCDPSITRQEGSIPNHRSAALLPPRE